MAISMRESSHSWQSQLTVLGYGALVIVALLQPGVLIGGALTVVWWRWRRGGREIAPWPLLLVGLVSCLAALVAVSLGAVSVAWGWPWRLWLAAPGGSPWLSDAWTLPAAWPAVWASITAEALAGPAWAAGILFIRWTQEGMPSGMVQREQRKREQRLRRLGVDERLAQAKKPAESPYSFRLGVDAENYAQLDLTLPRDLAQHVSVLGKMGSGKTTTAARLIEGAMGVGWPIVIIDAKGFGSLRAVAMRLAERYRVPFQLVAPDDAASLKYNPCRGTPSQISNKLIGAFTFGAEAEIYKNIAQEVIPVLVRAIRAAGRPLSLDALFWSLSPEGMVGLTRHVPDKEEALRDHLSDLSGRKAPYPAALAGMRGRFAALLQGMYGQLFAVDAAATEGHVLDLTAAFKFSGVTYISLPAMEASEDVELMARVLAQDIKQVAAARIATGGLGHALLVLDEFAGLREASQLNDLLLQAREARIACVVATQFLPNALDAPALRHALLSAGMFISHQCSSEDAEAIAGIFGTRRTVEATHQIDYATGTSEKGSMRSVDEYRVHPNELRDLPCGSAAVRIEPGGKRRIAIVRVDRPADMEGQP